MKRTFTSSIASVQRVANEEDEYWNKRIKSLSDVSMEGMMVLNFIANDPLSRLIVVRDMQLFSHLPVTIDDCSIWSAGA